MNYKQSTGSRIFDILNYLFMCMVIFIMAYPFLNVFSISVSSSENVGRGMVGIFPRGFDIKAYEVIFNTNDIVSSYINTIIYTVVGTIFILLFVIITAYPLSQKQLYGRNTVSFIFALTMILPGGMIPSFLLVKQLHMLDTIWAMVIPPVFNFWFIVLARTNFQNVPQSLLESAKIDGAGHWRILFRIVVPLSKPILATIALFAAVGQWNSFFSALLYLFDSSKYPLQMILRKIILANDVNSVAWQSVISKEGGAVGSGFAQKVKMATIIAAIGPIILVYPYAQKYFIKGALIGSIKG